MVSGNLMVNVLLCFFKQETLFAGVQFINGY